MQHYIYRTKEKNFPKTIEHFVNHCTPVGIIDETRATKSVKQIRNETMKVNGSPHGFSTFIALSMPYEFNHRAQNYTLHFKNNSPAESPMHSVKIYVTSTLISKIEETHNGVTETITDRDYIDSNYKISGPNVILVKKDKVYGKIVTLDKDIVTYSFVDDGTHRDNQVDQSMAHGVYVPPIRTLETGDYFSFYQDASEQKVIYYYIVISKSPDGRISKLSNVSVCQIKENAPDVRFILESSDDFYTSDTPTWRQVDDNRSDAEIRVLKKNRGMASEIIDSLKPWDIKAEDSNLAIDGIRTLKIKNIWNKENSYCMERDKKVFRAYSELDGVRSEYTDPIKFDGTLKVMIDKMIILKSNVTALPENQKSRPIPLDSKDATTLKVYVRQGGIYFKDFFINDFETNNIDFPEHVVSSVTTNSRFPILNIKDSCIYSNVYNYTVYLFDETGKISEPIVAVI